MRACVPAHFSKPPLPRRACVCAAPRAAASLVFATIRCGFAPQQEKTHTSPNRLTAPRTLRLPALGALPIAIEMTLFVPRAEGAPPFPPRGAAARNALALSGDTALLLFFFWRPSPESPHAVDTPFNTHTHAHAHAALACPSPRPPLRSTRRRQGGGAFGRPGLFSLGPFTTLSPFFLL